MHKSAAVVGTKICSMFFWGRGCRKQQHGCCVHYFLAQFFILFYLIGRSGNSGGPQKEKKMKKVKYGKKAGIFLCSKNSCIELRTLNKKKRHTNQKQKYLHSLATVLALKKNSQGKQRLASLESYHIFFFFLGMGVFVFVRNKNMPFSLFFFLSFFAQLHGGFLKDSCSSMLPPFISLTNERTHMCREEH